MTRAFDVDHFFIADYTADDTSGKAIIAGLYGNEIVFNAPPPVWPPLWIHIAINPCAGSTSVYFNFVTPQNVNLMHLSGIVETGPERNPFWRINLAAQLPMVPFTGPGVYKFEAGVNGKKPHFRKEILFSVEKPSKGSSKPPVLVNLKAEYMSG